MIIISFLKLLSASFKRKMSIHFSRKMPDVSREFLRACIQDQTQEGKDLVFSLSVVSLRLNLQLKLKGRKPVTSCVLFMYSIVCTIDTNV